MEVGTFVATDTVLVPFLVPGAIVATFIVFVPFFVPGAIVATFIVFVPFFVPGAIVATLIVFVPFLVTVAFVATLVVATVVAAVVATLLVAAVVEALVVATLVVGGGGDVGSNKTHTFLQKCMHHTLNTQVVRGSITLTKATIIGKTRTGRWTGGTSCIDSDFGRWSAFDKVRICPKMVVLMKRNVSSIFNITSVWYF